MAGKSKKGKRARSRDVRQKQGKEGRCQYKQWKKDRAKGS